MGFTTLSREGVDAGELLAKGKARRKAGRFRTLPESRRLLVGGGRLFGRVSPTRSRHGRRWKGQLRPFPRETAQNRASIVKKSREPQVTDDIPGAGA